MKTEHIVILLAVAAAIFLIFRRKKTTAAPAVDKDSYDAYAGVHEGLEKMKNKKPVVYDSSGGL